MPVLDTRTPEPTTASEIDVVEKPEGPIVAAILAGGVGCFALGVLTTLSEASTRVADWLQWNDRVGPLSGKTLVAVIVWLVAWAILHLIFRNKQVETRTALAISLVLIGLGAVGTFPTFFQAFG
jgi:hypothetical protein